MAMAMTRPSRSARAGSIIRVDCHCHSPPLIFLMCLISKILQPDGFVGLKNLANQDESCLTQLLGVHPFTDMSQVLQP